MERGYSEGELLFSLNLKPDLDQQYLSLFSECRDKSFLKVKDKPDSLNDMQPMGQGPGASGYLTQETYTGLHEMGAFVSLPGPKH